MLPLRNKDTQDATSPFTLYDRELTLAWAVKYAERAVVVVAPRDWRLSQRLNDFARQRRVQIIPFPLSALSPAMVERLRTTYFIFTPLKRYPNHEKLLRRFIG